MSQAEPKKMKWDWRSWFSKTALIQGEQDENNGKIYDFEVCDDGRGAAGITTGGFHLRVKHVPLSYGECVDAIPWNWKKQSWAYAGRSIYTDLHRCSCSQGINGALCRHLASLMFHWEKIRGPFEYTQTEEELREEIRIKREEEERRIREEKERKEKLRRENERKKKQEQTLEVLSYFQDELKSLPPVPSDLVFRPDAILGKTETNRYQTEIYENLPEDKKLPEISISVSYDRNSGDQILEVVEDSDPEGHYVSMKLGRKEIRELRCDCGQSFLALRSGYYYSYSYRKDTMCAHALAAYRSFWERCVREKPGDETDKKGDRFLSILAGRASAAPETQAEKKRTQDIVLTPRITPVRNNGELQLTFEIGKAGERAYMIRGLEKLYQAVEKKEEYGATNKVSFDFSKHAFTADSEKWYDFLSNRVRNIYRLNRTLYEGNNWYYNSRQFSVGAGVPLDGSDLDIVYSLAEGSRIIYQRGTQKNAGETLVTAGPGRLGIVIGLTPEMDRKGRLLAVVLSASIPRLLKGNQYQYILDDEQFGRVSQEEMAALVPFLDAAGKEDSFRCRIGRRKFPELFYRVLPALRSSPHVRIVDEVGRMGEEFLPPEPEFAFYLDLEGNSVSCRAVVSYEEQTRALFGDREPIKGILRDEDQEGRVRKLVLEYFSEEDDEDEDQELVHDVSRQKAQDSPAHSERPPQAEEGQERDHQGLAETKPQTDDRQYRAQLRFSRADEETLVLILTEAVPALSQYGAVKGSDAFKAVHLRPAPRPSFQVSLESGLLDLSINTKDMTEAELLELLQSYRKKKRWHRLSSGDFVDLRNADSLEEIDQLAGDLDISMEELVRGSVRVPEYRALYVDKLLEEHEEIASSRDRHFKSLIRSFRTIRDADFEVSPELSDVLRPYQVHGFRWLSTLSQAGFGGILADEMGLGKTVQMLAFLKGKAQDGEEKPALVVCPASLVYNWAEECSRFTPGLSALTLAGNLPQRKKILQQAGTKEGAQLYITSYDLLKRDIALYEGLSFSTVVLDEAQFIKNQKAAVTKAVKVLRAGRRFALTGTPIENRLSELWSIFDFLMPGFLYTASEFSSRFEVPVMKKMDKAASARLAGMTSPFILRRKKADVLKELPDKLEETKSSHMEGEQRKLYDAQVVHMKEMLSSFSGTGEDKVRILAEITKLRQICCDPSLLFEKYRGGSAKREACLDLVKSAIDGGHRMLIFSQFTSMMALLSEDLKKEGIPFFTITGATPKQERLRLVNEFNGGETPVFLISLRAGGTGLNLTGADVVIHYDPWWNLAVQNQATDRAHRIGQTRQVTVIRLIAAQSIEEKIVALQEAKRELADAIISTENTSLMSLSKEDLMALLS